MRVSVFERERSSNECDLFVAVRESVVIVVNGSVRQYRGSAIVSVLASKGVNLTFCSFPRD